MWYFGIFAVIVSLFVLVYKVDVNTNETHDESGELSTWNLKIDINPRWNGNQNKE
jgi:hypothetical protein